MSCVGSNTTLSAVVWMIGNSCSSTLLKDWIIARKLIKDSARDYIMVQRAQATATPAAPAAPATMAWPVSGPSGSVRVTGLRATERFADDLRTGCGRIWSCFSAAPCALNVYFDAHAMQASKLQLQQQ